jgi:nicotinamidase-related amidase
MNTALLVVDVQQSFTQRPDWQKTHVPAFLQRLQTLIDQCVAQHIPVVQIFHVNDPPEHGKDDSFTLASGHVRTLEGLHIYTEPVIDPPPPPPDYCPVPSADANCCFLDDRGYMICI